MDFSPGSFTRQLINKEFMSPIHKDFRDIYFSTFTPSETNLIKILYYQDLSKQQKVILFCDWFKQWFPTQNFIQVLEDHTKIWKAVDGRAFKAHHPPTENLTLTRKSSAKDSNEKDCQFEATALVAPPTNNIKICKALITLNNWTNMALYVVGRQLDRMESAQVAVQAETSTTVHPTDIHPPLSVPDFKLTNKQDEDFMDLLVAKLSKTSLSILQEDGGALEEEAPTDSSEIRSHIQNLEASLQKLEYEPGGIKTYYKRPTP